MWQKNVIKEKCGEICGEKKLRHTLRRFSANVAKYCGEKKNVAKKMWRKKMW
eukprot:TRINITY_DN778_c0_g1_i1.p4 TRINITY_DN778_c0_g1~~TRINITY_DN778_c0_g1_i1.p4  ORF type:complete len:52 (-),score=11.37 TRINITY_DN778_c0_g1_i1:10-165(-)